MNSKHKKTHSDNKEEIDLEINQKKKDLFKGETNQDKSIEKLEKLHENNQRLEEENQKQDKLMNYEDEISQLREEKLRLLAEMENLRKRSIREKSESIKFGSTNLARDILSTNDNLIRALENVPDDKNIAKPVNNLVEGIKMVQKEFTIILERHGIKKIDVLNKKFDHNLHQAMLEIETDSEEKGVVVKEIQPGYIMHDRLLRPAMVGVSKESKKSKEKK